MSNRNPSLRSLAGVFAFFLASLVVAPLAAQQGPEEERAKELVRQINEDLEQIIKDLSTLSGRQGAEAGDRVVENIEKLLEGLSGNQSDVVKNIDELVKQIKTKSGGSGESNSNQPPKDGKPQGQKSGKQPKNGRKSDKNKGEGDKERGGQKPEEKGGEKESQGKPEKQGDGDPEGGENPKDPKQARSGRKPRDKDPEINKQDPILDAWGFLPDEMRQKLIEGNFRDYFPNYEREIGEYLKSLQKKR